MILFDIGKLYIINGYDINFVEIRCEKKKVI